MPSSEMWFTQDLHGAASQKTAFFSIKMDLKAINRKMWNRFLLGQDMDQWWALENTIINLCGP
jgi:hypothetical protein